MSRQVEQREQGIFVAESNKVVQRLLESDFTVISLLLPEKWYYEFEPLLAKRAEDIQVYILEKAELERLTGFTFYQGVLGLGKIPPLPTLEELIDRSSKPRLFAAVESVSSAENLGSLIRNCAGFGVQGVLVDRGSTSPYLRRAVRGSMGTIFKTPALEQLDLLETVRFLQGRGIRCYAAHPHTEGRFIQDATFLEDICVVFGSEGNGISPALLKACDDAYAIPMAPGVDSLNVGSAAAVILYEVFRQRRGKDEPLDSKSAPTSGLF